MLVYQKIRKYIEENGMTQASVARKAGIPTRKFNAIMNGRRNLYADELKLICQVLNVNPEKFIEV